MSAITEARLRLFEAGAVLLTAERISLPDLRETLVAAALHTTQDACALLTQELRECDAERPPLNVTTEPSVILPAPTASAPPTSPMVAEEDRSVAAPPSSRRSTSVYNEFISEVLPLVRTFCPQANHKSNLSLAASLWTRYKTGRSLDDILKLARADLEARAAARGGQKTADGEPPMRSLSILLDMLGGEKSMPDLEDA